MAITQITKIDMNSIVENYYKYSKKILLFIGFWPEGNKFNLLRLLRFLINFIILSTATLAEFYYGYLHRDNFLECSDGITPALSKFVTILKLICLVLQKSNFSKLFSKIRNFKYNGKFISIIARRQSLAEKYAVALLFFSNCVIFSYFARPLVDNFLSYLANENNTRDMPFRAMFLWDYQKSPIYEFCYIWLTYSGTVVVFSFTGIDSIFLSSCLYIAGMYEVLKEHIEDLIENTNETKIKSEINSTQYRYRCTPISKTQNDLIAKQLKVIIALHSHIMSVSRFLMKVYTPIILMHFITAALVVAFSSINFIMAYDFRRFIYMVYNVSALTQLFLYCAGGSYMLDESINISAGIYSVEWYRLDIRNQKILLQALTRANTGFRANVPFFTLSLETFASICRSAGSYITVLKTFF